MRVGPPAFRTENPVCFYRVLTTLHLALDMKNAYGSRLKHLKLPAMPLFGKYGIKQSPKRSITE